MDDLRPYLAEASKEHSHLCPRLVLGVRMALAGARALGMERPAGRTRNYSSLPRPTAVFSTGSP